MRVWDQVSLLLLGIVAVLTPYEVAFMQLHVDFLFFFNRAIDLAFAFDMVLNFFLAYRNTEDGVWVRSHAKIAARYLRGWFLIDLLSVLPFDMFSFVMRGGGDASAAASREWEEREFRKHITDWEMERYFEII